MSDTYGQLFTGSSASSALSASLASRCLARFDLDGSMEYSMRWSRMVTPAGRYVCQLAASARRTSDSGFSGWPTPTQRDEKGATGQPSQQRQRSAGHARSILAETALLSGWPTPQAHDAARGPESKETKDARGSGGVNLHETARLAGWATPIDRDWKDSPGMSREREKGRTRNDTVARQAHGATSPSSPAQTARPGALNPALPCWLLGFPSSWLMAAPVKARRGQASSGDSEIQSATSSQPSS